MSEELNKGMVWLLVSTLLILIITIICFYMIKPGEVGIIVDLFGDKKG